MSGLTRHMHHRPCARCGHGRCHHERTRVYGDDGPTGTYHYEYGECPDGEGVYTR